MPKKVDSNQKEIVNYLCKRGCSILYLHTLGRGAPDLCVGYKGFNILVEVKSEKGDLNKLQQEWVDLWNGDYWVFRSVEDVEDMLKWYDKLESASDKLWKKLYE